MFGKAAKNFIGHLATKYFTSCEEINNAKLPPEILVKLNRKTLVFQVNFGSRKYNGTISDILVFTIVLEAMSKKSTVESLSSTLKRKLKFPL